MKSKKADLRDVTGVVASLARGVLGSRYAPEIPARMIEMLGRVASRADRGQVAMALRALDTRSGSLFLTGRPVPVSRLSPARAEAVVQRWQESRFAAQRRLADVIVALALSECYGHPSALWDAIGYAGPLGDAPDGAPELHPIEITHDERPTCDVVIVGSGAGGACVAGVLAQRGFDVIVIEKGAYNPESSFDHHEAEAYRRMYLYGLTLSTTDSSVRILAGSTLGGGTVVNYSTSFRTPDFVLREWTRLSGVDAFASGEFDESLDEVSERLGVNTDSSAAGRRDAIMEEGLKRLGWHVDMMPRAVRGCAQDETCGYCGMGCRLGAKQSATRTYLADAAAAGARIVVGAEVDKVLIDDGRAVGVEARSGGHRWVVNARAVVAAGGAIETPALLLRSGLAGAVGHHLHLHPGTAAWGVFDDEVRIWEGTLQARYSTEFRYWDGGYGPTFETVPVHPGAGSTAVPWLSASDHARRMNHFKNISHCAVLPRDRSAGRVFIARDGRPRVRYRLGAGDERRLIEGVTGAGKVLEAAGAIRVSSPHRQPISYRTGEAGGHDRWSARLRAAGLKHRDVTFFSFHQMGSCRMGAERATSAVGVDNQTHEVAGLYVADASAFPTASGVNPMLTVYAIANRAAKKIAERLS